MAIPKYEEALKNAILNNDWTKCGDENYEGGREHFRDRVDCMKQISKAIADGDTKEFEDLMQYDDNRRIVNFYKEPLLERVIKHKPEFFKPLLERSSEVRDYYHCNMDDLHKLDSKRFVAYLSTNKQVTPLTLLIGAIKEDKREVVAMILSSFHNQVTLAYKTASDLKKKPIMDYLRQLATENKSYKVLPYLLDYDKYISHEDYGDWGATNDIPISDSLDEISSRLYKAENLERKAQRDYPNDKPIPPYISKGRKKIVDRKLKLIKAVLAKKKEDVTKKDVMQFFSLLVDAGCYVLDDLDGAKEFVHDHALALLKLSVSYRRYTLLAPLMQIEGVRQVALDNITKICNKVSWFDWKLRKGLRGLMKDLTTGLKPAIKTNTFNPLKHVKGVKVFKGFKGVKGVKKRLSAMKSSLGFRKRAAATRRGASFEKSENPAPSSSLGSRGLGKS